MGVYIKGVTKSQLMKVIINSTEFMPDDFEVIEVKTPHGRLVDIRDINELMNRYKYDDFDHIDYHTPTVIKAEESE